MFSRRPAPLLLSLSALFWGGNFVIGRWVHGDIAPFSLTFWRWVVAALILMPFVWKEVWAHRSEIRKHIGLLFVLALTGMVMFHSFTYIALRTTTAINAAFVLASMPMVIPIVSMLVGDEVLNIRQGLGILVSIIGVGIIVSQGQITVLMNFAFTPGDLWVLAGVLAWSVYSVLLRRKPESLPPMVLLASTMCLAVVILAPFYVWEVSKVGGFALSLSNGLVIGYVAVFASIAAFWCWNTGVARMGANKAGLFIHLIPLFASILSIIFLNESLQMFHIIGIVPILIGIALTTTSRPAMSKSKEA
ncbi:MAG: DMT family transporter [Magnetovibrio sp.]|nr:DMT family transporter [Magnetovibrio sp.]